MILRSSLLLATRRSRSGVLVQRLSTAQYTKSARVFSTLATLRENRGATSHWQYASTSIRSLSSSQGGRPRPKGGMGRAALGAGIFAAFTGKAKFIFAGLKLFKFTPVLSMIGTSLTYSFFFGWPYSVGMVGLVAIHEAGHAIALRHFGQPFSPFVMVPFMGAVISAAPPKNAWEDSVVAIAGPITGTIGAVAVGAGAAATDSQLLFALADFGYMINLFNLMPIGSMDGGRIGNAIHPAVSCLGIAGGASLIYTGAIANPIFYLIMASGTYTTGKRLLGYDDYPPSFYKMSSKRKVGMTASYLALIGFLLGAQQINSLKKRSPRELGYKGRGLDEQIDIFFDDGDGDGGDTTVFRIER